MLTIFNENYYLDLDRLEDYINIEKTKPDTPSEDGEEDSMQHISIVKYEVIKMMIEVIMTESEEIDEVLGHKNSSVSIPFKLALNTLLNQKIINKFQLI